MYVRISRSDHSGSYHNFFPTSESFHHKGNYKLKPGDEIRVVIWKEFDEKALVRPDRKISLPMIGEVSCKGKTIDELNQELSDKFDVSTVLMVTKYHAYKDTIKEVIGSVRDISFLYLLVR